MPFAATRMDLEIIIVSEVSQRQTSCDITYHLYVESKKRYERTFVFTNQKQTQKMNLWVPKEEGVEKDKLVV